MPSRPPRASAWACPSAAPSSRHTAAASGWNQRSSHGATFTFSLPRGTPPTIDLSDDGAPINPEAGGLMSTPTPIALVLEDEREIRQVVRTSLEVGRAGRWSRPARIKQGLVEAATRRPDLIIVDLGLPDGDGVDFIRAGCAPGRACRSSCCRRAPTRAEKVAKPWMRGPTTTSPSPSAWPNCWHVREPTCGGCGPAGRRRTATFRFR